MIKNKPLVSISCVTYNHAPYLRQCLDGFFMQKCDFEYEILLHDDASTDGSQEIVKEYMEKYPGIIKPIFQTKNQYSQGVRSMSMTFNAPRAQGKYIALCESDDYWTDPLKLQKQVDFLEENEDYIACGCYVDIIRQGKLVISEKPLIDKSYNQLDLIGKHPFPTLTTLFRNIDLKEFSEYKIIVGDIELFMYLSQYGNFKKLPFRGGVYRIHPGGVNSGNAHYANKTKNTLAKLKFNKAFKLYPNKLYKVRLKYLMKIELKRIFKNIILGRKGVKDSINFIKFCLEQYKLL